MAHDKDKEEEDDDGLEKREQEVKETKEHEKEIIMYMYIKWYFSIFMLEAKSSEKYLANKETGKQLR